MACPLFAPVADFDAQRYFPDNKTLRLMNRDAQMAVVAARLAMQDAAPGPRRVLSARGNRPVRRDRAVRDAAGGDRAAGP